MSSWSLALAGGVLIGVGATLLWFVNGRVAGISGILGGALAPQGRDERPWRLGFLAGLIAVALLAVFLWPQRFGVAPAATIGNLGWLIGAGLAVGVGTQLANGCTSGHGVCGMSRGSPRSLSATLTFMATGAAALFLVRHVLGGA